MNNTDNSSKDNRNLSVKQDMPIFFDKQTLKRFESMGINSFGDLINEYNNGIFNDISHKNNSEVKGQIELLMNFYIGTPLIATAVLKEKGAVYKAYRSLKEIKKSMPKGTVFHNNSDINAKLIEKIWPIDDLQRTGITKEELIASTRYLANNLFFTRRGDVEMQDTMDSTILDLMRCFTSDTTYRVGNTSAKPSPEVTQNISFKCSLFEKENGLRRHFCQTPSQTILDDLKEQLIFLERCGSTMDGQIELLTKQIKNVEKRGPKR